MGLVTWEFGDKGIRRKQRSGAFWEGRYEATMVDSGDRQSAVPCLASFARLSHTGGCMVPGPLTKNWLLAGPALLASAALALLAMAVATASAAPAGDKIDFNRDVRRILSENCFRCHGPDAKERKDGKKALRLDLPESARAQRGNGHTAIVPGHPEKSELVRRITTEDLDDKMPPPDSGKKLTPQEIALLKKWIAQGADYSRHWAYAPPRRAELPKVREAAWPRNAIDYFVLARLEREKVQHAPEAERAALIRRVTLDLTGLPPALPEVEQFMADRQSGAYERLVERLFQKETFGEHWARLWLDQARYADSSGYADDPARTIWAYRDYVIRAFNQNKHFDQFTLEQIAGDLLENPTDEELVATAFHRNTMTNNEGGTNDEEYRNVAIVDRVNTTMAVWMGTTMACAQCHNHKYDPISQEDYFRLFAILNNTADADRGDESPVQALYTPEQKRQRQLWQTDIARLEKVLRTPTPELEQTQAVWEKTFTTDVEWQPLQPLTVKSKAGADMQVSSDGVVRVARGGKTDVYTLELPVTADERLTALRLEVLPDESTPAGGVGHGEGNFVVSRVLAAVAPSVPSPAKGRYVRIELAGKEKILSLAEVQVFSGATNVAVVGTATQSSTAYEGAANRAIDGNTSGDYAKANSTTHTATSDNPWWEVDLKFATPVERIIVWNRTDSSPERLGGFKLALLDEERAVVWQQRVEAAPSPSAEFHPDGLRPITFARATADFSQKDFEASSVLDNKDPKARGWAISPKLKEPHALTLVPKRPVSIGPGSNLVVTIEQLSKFEHATIAKLRLTKSSDERAPEFVRAPTATLAILRRAPEQRSADEQKKVRDYYLSIAPGLKSVRDELAGVKKQLEDSKPYTTVPVLSELTGDKRRKTRVQLRGNFLNLGAEVTDGLPPALGPAPGEGKVDRLTLAHWLVSTNNPLTARVVVNRLWEAIFGIGLVRTSEEFGAQGELPSHPELLDWLAVESMEHDWDINHLLRLLVTSATYRQSSRVTPELAAQDPDNRLLARGPRFRLSAEMIRDQALFVSGLLSSKMYGPPVKPPQPKLGLSAAFGSGTDWEPSGGEDRYRRALYTTWRRSNPYPSMATFDAPNREVCLVRRERSNTPLQALVTLNDPVYVEAAQALARKMADGGATPAERARHGFRLCLSREPSQEEWQRLVGLYQTMRERFDHDAGKAREFASKPLGEIPAGAEPGELAAWTVVGNVLLNLDEMLMKR
jgi:cytochrome c553